MSAPVDTKPKVEKKPKAPKAPKAKDANASPYPLEVMKKTTCREICVYIMYLEKKKTNINM